VSFPPDAPEPDALDQATPAVDDIEDDDDVEEETPPLRTGPEVSEADALDQRREVPLDDEWDR
jgi:hypothetical protein